ncbi:LysE family translocator [Pseudoalteromonas sp. NEC-BIFX-2020_002]|uniref:LysE family translocator n=1 Tax=Pseudoalteromonas sp. NEC-BIFX-2020_002 TaxID=2732353 RepID=UPI0014769A32|nr:LysE family translocator [Pseudoalteromonas sp. NEC-BIFX-2020_002]NNG41857.1 LysE family translocator [Pseudoalteromonas sp. NEC-BIFX-2020_002]
MNIELLSALALFALVSSVTPGPNNLMLMNSGANFGFRRTLPHLLGVTIGFVIMLVLVGLGVMQLFDVFPLSYQLLKVLCIAYLLYLAYKIASNKTPVGAENGDTKPFTFVQAALFQWVNPKAWTMALSAVSVYAPSKGIGAIVIVGVIFGLVNLPCVSAWTLLGQKLQIWLSHPERLQAFNIFMAILLVASVLFSML